MSIVSIVKEIKRIHSNDIAIIKVGKFYHAYGRDAYILSYIFNYQIKRVEQNVNTCGFPEMALGKIIDVLKDKSINYLVFEKKPNYEVVHQNNFMEKNKYTEVYNDAYRYITRKNKIDCIHEYFMDNINSDLIKLQIQKVEEIIYEGK